MNRNIRKLWQKRKKNKLLNQQILSEILLMQEQNNKLMLAIIDILQPDKKLNPNTKERNYLGKGVKF